MEAGRDPLELTGPDGCGSASISFPIHLSFQIFVSQIFLNLFTAIFVDGFVLQSQVEDLPVTQETVKAFVDEWQKLDVRGTSYISVRDLPKLITRLANSKKGQKMLVFPNLIRQGDKHDIDNYIRLLEIPTFRQLKRVMFHDVMQQLCLIVIKVQRNKDKLNEKLKLIDTHGSGLFHTPHRTFSAVSQLAMDVTFHNVKRSKFDFDVMIRNLGMLNHRITPSQIAPELRTLLY